MTATDNDIIFFCSEPNVSFTSNDDLNAAKSDFELAEPRETVIFLEFCSPNGRYFLRALNAGLNAKFMQFLRSRYDGLCTFYPAEVIK